MNDDNAAQLLIDAIDQNDIATASLLISSSSGSGSVNLNAKPWPLHRATEHGRLEIMTMLLDAVADINAVDGYYRTACRVAIWNNQFDALKLLVERGADLNVADVKGGSLLSMVAQSKKNEQYVTLLLEADAPIDGLSSYEVMSLVRSVALFNRLVARGVNFTAMRDERGATLCHHVACNVSCEDDLRVLLNVCGNDIRAVDNNGASPLHWASLSGNDSTLCVVVEFGAEIDRQDNGGWTALLNASRWPTQMSRVKLLLALGTDVGLGEHNGRTACHNAAGWRTNVALCLMVAAGGDLDEPDNKGDTPRMIANRYDVQLPTADEIDAARRRNAKTRLDLVRDRAFQICLGLQSLDISALQLCEILMHSFGALGSLIAFHQWWAIATKVKHFRDHNQQSRAATAAAATTTTTTTTTTNNKQRDKDTMKK